MQEDFTYEDAEALCSTLRSLATDSNKYRAKADRRRQRATFRAVLHFVEVCVGTYTSERGCTPAHSCPASHGPSASQDGECEEDTVRFGLEVLYVDSWARRRVYAAFKDVLGSGMHHHLQVGRQTEGTPSLAALDWLELIALFVPRTTSCSVMSLAWALCWC